jgi:hypothetical protein
MLNSQDWVPTHTLYKHHILLWRVRDPIISFRLECSVTKRKAKEKQEGLDCKYFRNSSSSACVDGTNSIGFPGSTAFGAAGSGFDEPAAPKAVEPGKPIEFVPSTQAEDEEFRKYHL